MSGSRPSPKDLANGEIRNQRICEMLTHVVYVGYTESPKWGVGLRKGHHEGLISFEKFEKIQKRLKTTVKASAREDISTDFPLRGFILCADCDNPLTACWSQGKNQRYPFSPPIRREEQSVSRRRRRRLLT